MLVEAKTLISQAWSFLVNEIDWADVGIHVGVSIAMTAAIGWWGNAWYGAAIACTLFYGREQAQQAYKDNPPVGWRLFVPIYWGPHGKAEFLPVVPAACIAAFCVEAARV